MTTVAAWGATAARKPLEAMRIERREPLANDVKLDILYCGICHSDIHQARDEWSGGIFPMVPGHEILGRVVAVGSNVSSWKVGDLAGVGCLVNSCRTCAPCQKGTEQFCEAGAAFTYNGTEMDRKTPTYGGYSTSVTVDSSFALRIPKGLEPAGTAPLLCAGITTYSPLRQWNCKKGDRVAVAGLGGLGHMAVKLAAAMGAEVTVLSTSPSKKADAQRLGAADFALTTDAATLKKLQGRFDIIINTVSAPNDYNRLLSWLKPYGTMVLLGVPPEPTPLAAIGLIMGNKRLVGSLIGGIPETQEMLNFCGEKGIVSDVEIIPINKVNEAYERMLKGDVKYRFVIDLASLKA